ncbi:MAG: hypothetical protein QHC67_13865 [Sphingobium sp.]|uniref:hypothetical protein n=1 Tax=Sphingobium sp. TaxID=1912891 RepID=UPI0029BC9541|nr:hypothetical protein [Sphingobium sp.]MDX3910886.1 hypothetical protein [Sphingobium sp.]
MGSNYDRLMADWGDSSTPAKASRTRSSGGSNYDKLMAEWGDDPQPQQAPKQARRAPPRPVAATPSRLGRVFKSVDTFVHGMADTITFGYLDEASAWIDSKVAGVDYQKRLAENRRAIKDMEDNNGAAYLSGQIAGAVTSIGGSGLIGNGARAGKAALRAGASRTAANAAAFASRTAQGAAVAAGENALYSAGSSEEGSRLKGALEGAAWGAAGGMILGGVIMPVAGKGYKAAKTMFARGKAVEIKAPAPRIKPAEVEAPKAPTKPSVTPKASSAADAPASKPVREEGSILAPEELLGDPAKARAAIDRRLGRLTPEEATKMAARLENAEAAGTVIDDPHYRSLLHVELPEGDIDQEQVLRAAEILEDATQAIQEKAGAGTRTMGSMDHQLREALKGGTVLDDLTEAMERSHKGIADARVGSHVMTLAGVQFAKARAELLPEVVKKTEGAREALTEKLTQAAQLFAMGKGIVGNTARALRSLQGDTMLGIDDVADDVIDLVDPAQIRARVSEAVKELKDDDLADLIGRIKDTNDLARIGELLTSKEEAAAFSAWRRTRESVSTWLRSNALSPATGMFNGISGVMHDFFRNDMAKAWAARGLQKIGKEDEALALRLELAVSRSVYWKAQQAGFKEMLKRIKWEGLSEIEKIAGVGIGNGKVAKAANAARGEMVRKGYVPKVEREFEKKPRLSIEDHQAFQEKLKLLETEGGAFAKLYANAQRIGASTLNAVDALGGASMKLFTTAVDDWGRSFVKLKETYALSARYAVREGLAHGLNGDELAAFVETRAKQLAEMPTAEIMNDVEMALLKGEDLPPELRFQLGRERAVELEADRTLFMDGPQTAFGNSSAKSAAGLDRFFGLGLVEGVLLPYIRTPIRLFERGLVSYTPWAARSTEVRKVLARGGVEADIVKAQMELGGHAIKLGMLMGLTGTLQLTNGEFGNTKGLDEGPPNRIQIGPAYLEVGRLDPFSLTVAIGGFLGQAIKEGFQDGTEYDVEEGITTALQIAFLAAKDSILGKSYLTGLRDVTDVLLADDGGDAATKASKILGGMTQRLLPMAGTGRMINDTGRALVTDDAIEAVSWTDQMLRAIPGAGMYMPVRRDILGDPVKGRAFGINMGLDSQKGGGSDGVDAVKATLRDLEITLQDIRRTDPTGFKLSGKQLDRLRELRGHEVLNSYGQTMREALGELFDSEYFKELPEKEQKKQIVMETIRDFNEPAREMLAEEDEQYGSNRMAYKSFEDYISDGMSEDEAALEVTEEAEAEGLPEPEL